MKFFLLTLLFSSGAFAMGRELLFWTDALWKGLIVAWTLNASHPVKICPLFLM